VVTVCCDTSFLFSLYGRDANTPRAAAVARKTGAPLTLSPFNEYEFENATRLAVFQGSLSSEIGLAMLADYEADKADGRVITVSCNLAAVLTEARRLSASYTLSSGHRGFDILHVAAAKVMRADSFISFDKNQRALAKAAGMKVLP